MATKTAMTLLLATVVLAAAMTAADGKGKAAAPVDCTSVVLGMSDCLSYVSNGSTTTTPEGGCCEGLKQVLKTAPSCLCQAYKQSAQFGVVLNNTKALQLPAACKVHAPPVASCGLTALTPAGAPAGAVVPPVGSPSSSVAGAPAAGASSETSPAAAPSKTNASPSIRATLPFVLAIILAAFFSSF